MSGGVTDPNRDTRIMIINPNPIVNDAYGAGSGTAVPYVIAPLLNLKNVLSAVPVKVEVAPKIPVPVLLTITSRMFVAPRLNPVVKVPETRLVKLKGCSAPPSVKVISPLPGSPLPESPITTPLSSSTARSSELKPANERVTAVAFSGRKNASVASQKPSKLAKLPPVMNVPFSV